MIYFFSRFPAFLRVEGGGKHLAIYPWAGENTIKKCLRSRQFRRIAVEIGRGGNVWGTVAHFGGFARLGRVL
jgi:hypothetical protein